MTPRRRAMLVVAGAGLLALSALALIRVPPPDGYWLGAYPGVAGLALILAGGLAGLADRRFETRGRPRPHLPPDVDVIEEGVSLDLDEIRLPVFRRSLAHPWTDAVRLQHAAHDIVVFEMVHADMWGEGGGGMPSGPDGTATGDLSFVTCVLVEIDTALPLMVLLRRGAPPVTLPNGLIEHEVESASFNRSFRLLTEDRYAATAALDARTMREIEHLDPRFMIEMVDRWIAFLGPHLDEAGMSVLIEQTTRVMSTFPSVVGSLFPAQTHRVQP